MFPSVQGVYRRGKIDLVEKPGNVPDETRVIVTFLESGVVELRARGIDEEQAAELRARLGAFVEDWDSPEMSIYDNYAVAQANL